MMIFNDANIHVSSNYEKSSLCQNKVITLQVNYSISNAEGYELIVRADNDCISITGSTMAGIFYGVVSLISLSVPKPRGAAEPSSYWIPSIKVVDTPRYEYRGLMVDVVRNFHTKEELGKLLEAMAMYKLNKLHLHLGGDEGWRLEILGLEELTEAGVV